MPESTKGSRRMTDLRAEATRIGYWNEGLAQYEVVDPGLSAFARALILKSLIQPAREDDPTHECD
jgi:hypothetical protein